jgi:hypothetical protein
LAPHVLALIPFGGTGHTPSQTPTTANIFYFFFFKKIIKKFLLFEGFVEKCSVYLVQYLSAD